MEVNFQFQSPDSCTHSIGGWVGPRARLNLTEKRKISFPYRESNPDSSDVHPVAWSLYWLSYLSSPNVYKFRVISGAGTALKFMNAFSAWNDCWTGFLQARPETPGSHQPHLVNWAGVPLRWIQRVQKQSETPDDKKCWDVSDCNVWICRL
jgi:hypothetical protein